MGELDAMANPEFFPKLRFDGLLLGREKGADRIVHEIQEQTAVGATVSQPVQQA